VDKDSKHDEQPDEYNPPPIVVAPDGGISAGFIGQPAAVPERTPANFICLRGPCRHYWHLVTMAGEGNPADTWEHLGISAPRQHHHTCLMNPGFETSFADDNAFECNKWDPIDGDELVQIRARRIRYYDAYPEHAPDMEKDNDD
jgi:hypothetical protein